MTPEQALQYLMQVLVLKDGLSISDAAGVVAAWNVIAEKVRNDGGRSKESPTENPAQVQTS